MLQFFKKQLQTYQFSCFALGITPAHYLLTTLALCRRLPGETISASEEMVFTDDLKLSVGCLANLTVGAAW